MGKSTTLDKFWITWEHQRRSIELAKALGVRLFVIESSLDGLMKYVILSLKTIRLIFKYNAKQIFVQNPSNILAALICFLKKIKHFSVIVDRHSNFIFTKLEENAYSKFSIFLTTILSNFSIRNADLTIVTNEYIKQLVEKKGGRAFILRDKIPYLDKIKKKNLKGKINIVFPCTFSPDEPIDAVIKSGNYLGDDICIYITGKYKKYLSGYNETNIPKQVIFTGFLPEDDYINLLASSDIILALTNRPHTLLCCAYEAVALCKPLVLSDHEELRNYFYKGRKLVKNTEKNIAISINSIIDNYKLYLKEITQLKYELEREWFNEFNKLQRLIEKV